MLKEKRDSLAGSLSKDQMAKQELQSQLSSLTSRLEKLDASIVKVPYS